MTFPAPSPHSLCSSHTDPAVPAHARPLPCCSLFPNAVPSDSHLPLSFTSLLNCHLSRQADTTSHPDQVYAHLLSLIDSFAPQHLRPSDLLPVLLKKKISQLVSHYHVSSPRAECVLFWCSLVNPQCLEQRLAQMLCSINICAMNESKQGDAAV